MWAYLMEIDYLLQKKRILTLYSLGFLLVFGYAIARPCIDSILLEHYSNDILPKAWLITAIASIFVIAFYNRFNQKHAILTIYGGISLISAVSLIILLAIFFMGFIPAIFILYIWKEIYMVVLMETYWSYANIVFCTKTAKNRYGRAMTVASVGGLLGNLIVSPLALYIGTKATLCFLVIFLLLGFLIAYLARHIADEKPVVINNDFNLGVKTLFKSKYLVPLAILVCTVQVVIGLIDYNFNGLLKEHYVDTDARTALLGQIHAAINIFGVMLQFLTGIILKYVGIAITFSSIPFLLGGFVLAFVMVPKFLFMILVKISSKTLDYSLLRGTKEILYIPLSRSEKTQGKGIIDIFFYRLAKGLSSLLLFMLISFDDSSYVMKLSLLLIVLWLILAIIISKRYQKLIKASEEV